MPNWLTPALALVGSVLGSLIVTAWRFARLESDVERMKIDIGTHETGLRGSVHRTSNAVTALEMRMALLEKEKE